MYERLTQLLEAELLRMNGDEQNLFTYEPRENVSLSSSVPVTRENTSNTETTASNDSVQLNNELPPEGSDTKRSSTRPGRNTIVYDELGNAWDSEELERKQKNPYRWFIEKQQKTQKAKEATKEDEATSAMVKFSTIEKIAKR